MSKIINPYFTEQCPLSKLDGIAALTAMLYWAVYCYLDIDLQFFEYENWKYRGIFLLLLVFAAIAICRLVARAVLQKDPFSRKFLRYAAIHMGILLVFMLLLWPGTWSWDDIRVLNLSRTYDFVQWQHYLSSVAVILSAYFLPSAAGVVIVQLVIVAGVTGYSLALLDLLYLDIGRKYHGLAVLVAELAFLMPPILFYDYSKFRNSLCIYLELLLFALVWRMVKFPKLFKLPHVLLLLVVAVLVASWRSENFYYAFLVFGLLLFAVGRTFWKRCLAGTLAVCLAVFAIGQRNTDLIGNHNYEIMAIINPAVTLIRTAESRPDGLSEGQRQSVEAVIDWNSMMEQPYRDGPTLFWEGGVKGYTSEEYRAFQKTYVQMILRYPLIFLQERGEMFWNTLGFNDSQYDPYVRTINIFVPGSIEAESWQENGEALNVSLRAQTIRLLTGRRTDGSKNLGNHLFWNLLPPMLFAAAVLEYGFLRRKWLLVYVGLCNLCKVPLIFLTAPDTYFMYYMSVYLFGYVVAFFALAVYFNRKCNTKVA